MTQPSAITIHEKLLDIQQNLKAPKDLWNDFSKFSYRSAETIVEALKPLLKEHSLTLIIEDDMLEIGDRNYIRATVALHDGKEKIVASAYAREEIEKKGMDAAQITGSASSYARKYALNGLLAIDDTKDPDGHKPSESKTTPIVVPSNIKSSDSNTYIAEWQIKMLLSKARDFSGLADKAAIIQWFTEKAGIAPNKVKKLDFAKIQKLLEEEKDV